jgi:signal transduction histidine kinase/CheY-like chemotaxis protein
LEFVHPEDRSKSVAALDTLEGDRQVLGFENRCWHKDGSFRWLSWSAFPLGESDEIFAVARDVTERKSLEEQIIHAQRHEAMGTLAGGLAHDLNNILTPIIMVAGLRLETVTDPDDREMMELVKASAQRGANIIAQLLTYSRGLQGEYLPVSVQHLIKEITALARETFPRNITVIADVDTDLWTVVSDATQVHQILMNLCVNARDAMPEGGELRIAARNVDITVGDLCLGQGDRLGSYVHLSVSDTGTGIPQEILDQIFDPFFSTKRTGKGSGLGLSSVLGIVRNHGGFIKVDSKPDSGTTFNINLPAERVASVAVQDKPVPAAVGHGETILVVDDEKSVILVARRCLERNGYRVLTAINGQEAIEVFVAHQTAVKLVLTDLMMPMMDGVTLARELHALAPAIRVIATSGLEPVENASIVEFISKPFKPNALLAAVARQLQSPVTCQPSVRLES